MKIECQILNNSFSQRPRFSRNYIHPQQTEKKKKKKVKAATKIKRKRVLLQRFGLDFEEKDERRCCQLTAKVVIEEEINWSVEGGKERGKLEEREAHVEMDLTRATKRG